MRRIFSRLAAAAMVAATVSGPGNSAVAAEPTTLRFGLDTEHNINGLTLAVADQEGFLAREGLKLQQTEFLATKDRDRNRDALLAALKKGDINFTRVQTPFLIEGAAKKTGIVGISGVVDNPVYFLVAGPNIKNFADLKAKVITEPRLGDILSLTARELLAQHGLSPREVTIREIAGSGPRVDCLLSGKCDAGTIDQPAVYKLFEAGFHTLALHSEAGALVDVVDIVDRDWAARNRDIVVKYLRASANAMRYIHDPKNRNEVVKVVMAVTAQPEKQARQMLEYYWDPKYHVLPQDAEIDMNGLTATIQLLAKYGFVKPPLPQASDMVDLSYAKEAGVR
ncbi:MAG TPA: ABC transporter substrate-binding protein [Micropepsaceae bacterium]|nr:ABC transporter substrate-binding protein [Micropepsaceae bacterium]